MSHRFSFYYGFENMCPKYARRAHKIKCNYSGLTEEQFKKEYRITKTAFQYILNETKLKSEKIAYHSILPMHKLEATIIFLTKGKYSERCKIHSDKKMIHETLEILEEFFCDKFIKLQFSEEEKQKSREWFQNETGFPDVIGVIGNIPVDIQRPLPFTYENFNDLGNYKINAMIICDYKSRIRSVSTLYSGVEDAEVWYESEERSYFKANYENGDKNSIVIGDSEYPLEPWLMTPHKISTDNRDSKEVLYNARHSKVLKTVQKLADLLKIRFKCLLYGHELKYTKKEAATILNVCCALHNLSILYDDENVTSDIYNFEKFSI